MSKFRVEKTYSVSIPASFQKELADFVDFLENEGLDYNLEEIMETIISKAPKTDKLENYADIDVVYIQYREGE